MKRRACRGAAAVALMLGCGCARSPRFADAPVVWHVQDRQHIPEPSEIEYHRIRERLDQFALRRLVRTLEVRDRELAHNVNSLGEVPNSSWFTNRIGVRDVAPQEAARGPSSEGPPRLPLTVTSGKPGGKNPGLVAEDASGRKFIVKFDRMAQPEMETATNLIVNRIFWTLGYNVPNDTIFYFTRDQLRLAQHATAEDEAGNERRMTLQDVDGVLATTAVGPDRRYRASASEFVPGIPKGGWPPEGVRADDPNDVVRHEHRRELRGLRVFAAWVNHTDMKQDNTLDTYVEEDGRHFLRHYLIDFGEAFAAFSAAGDRNANGFEYWVDYRAQSAAALSFGVWVRPWEALEDTPWPAIGRFSAENFDPEAWREMFPYWPFLEADAADEYWAAKLVMRFDRQLIRRIVEEGRLSHPQATEYLTDTLFERRTLIGKAYFRKVTPLDHFRIDERAVCAVDLSVRYGLVTSGLVQVLDEYGKPVFSQLVDADGNVCVPLPPDSQYRIYRLRVARGLIEHPVMRIHFKGGKHARILGIERLEH
ncbi:MAG TPA: hypothetical protein VI197_24800 [Polyangiaceae bacterium]